MPCSDLEETNKHDPSGVEWTLEGILQSESGSYDSALPTSGKCEDDLLLQRQVADVVDLYPLPLAPMAPGSSSHMDIDVPMDPSQENECNMKDLFELPSM